MKGFACMVNIWCHFVLVQRREAGFAELDVTVTSPLGQDLPLEVKSCGNEKDCDLIEFCPSLPGNYRFKMTYGGEEIPGILQKVHMICFNKLHGVANSYSASQEILHLL
jgi:filamin